MAPSAIDATSSMHDRDSQARHGAEAAPSGLLRSWRRLPVANSHRLVSTGSRATRPGSLDPSGALGRLRLGVSIGRVGGAAGERFGDHLGLADGAPGAL